MTTPLKISFSDLIAVALFYHSLNGGFDWYYPILMLFWGRFHILRRRLWHSMVNKAREIELTNKLKNEKNN